MDSGRGTGTGTGSDETGTGAPEVLPSIPTPRQGNKGMASADRASTTARRTGSLLQRGRGNAWLAGRGRSRASMAWGRDATGSRASSPYCAQYTSQRLGIRMQKRRKEPATGVNAHRESSVPSSTQSRSLTPSVLRMQYCSVILAGSHRGTRVHVSSFSNFLLAVGFPRTGCEKAACCARTETARGCLGNPCTQHSWPLGLGGGLGASGIRPLM